MSWAPGSLDGDGWAGSEDLDLKVLPAEVRPGPRHWVEGTDLLLDEGSSAGWPA